MSSSPSARGPTSSSGRRRKVAPRAASEAGQPIAAVQSLLDAGRRVLIVDVFGQGAGARGNRLVDNRAAAAYTFGYNVPLVVQRAHDTLAALRHARTLAGPRGRVTLVALDGQSVAWAALARAHAGTLVDAAAFATNGFRFGSVTGLEDAAFLPGGAKYGDLPALLTLAAPQILWLAGETPDAIALLKDTYRAAAAPKALTVSKASGERLTRDAIAWALALEARTPNLVIRNFVTTATRRCASRESTGSPGARMRRRDGQKPRLQRAGFAS